MPKVPKLRQLFRQRKTLIVFILIAIVFSAYKFIPTKWPTFKNEHVYLTQGHYLIYTPKCRIFNLNPWNADAKAIYSKHMPVICSERELLTEMIVDDNLIDVRIAIKKNHTYADPLICCVRTVTRQMHSASVYNDNSFKMDNCEPMRSNEVEVSNEDASFVTCTNTLGTVYENLHQPVALIDIARQKQQSFKDENRDLPALSVLVIGIDSISRLNMIRTMPNTRDLLTSDPNWLEFKIYQKIGDNTFPNLMAMFTGFNKTQAYEMCDPTQIGGMNDCELIWKRYADRNFITAYSEDMAKLSTFNFQKPGFDMQPTDYYFRPYHLACAHLLEAKNVDGYPFCSGPVGDGERVWSIARDFAKLHEESAYFAFFWTNSYSHDDVNTPTRMDDTVRDYMSDISATTEENTVLIFLSDHGMRFGPIRNTLSGYIEERLPFLFVKFPKWFREKYSDDYKHVQANTQRMVTPYDMYMTLQDIITYTDPEYEVQPALGCPKCHSIMAPIDVNRSCKDANVTQHWCTCTDVKEIPVNDWHVLRAATLAVRKLNEMLLTLDTQNLCVQFELNIVLRAFQAAKDFDSKAVASDVLIVEFETTPRAQFETTVDIGKSEVYSGFSRSDLYKHSSKCVQDPDFKKFCFCKDAVYQEPTQETLTTN